MRQLIPSVLFILFTLTVFQCNPERMYNTDQDAVLSFSMDTVYFDTVFTNIGTSTHSFKLYNPHNRYLKIDEIVLAGGDASVFRINVDGQSGTLFENYEIAPEDSMYVFVEATLGTNEVPDILRIQDSIIFKVNGNIQDVDLVAWGQDVHIINNLVIEESTTWSADKPYLIKDYVFVDSLQTLSIDAGVSIYMHRDAMIYVLGSVKINGTKEMPVLVQGDRLEEWYQIRPGQWGYIWLLNGSVGNKVTNTMIKGGTMGFFVNSPLYDFEPVLTITNTEINHMSYDGVLAIGSSIEAENLVVGECGNSCLEIIWGGAYSFTHSTFANYWPSLYSNRTRPAIYMNNFLTLENDTEYPGDVIEASFKNCIISGNNINEILIEKTDKSVFNYTFDHCLTKIDTGKLDYTNDPNFINIINNENPLFAVDTLSNNPIYELDSLSPAINIGFLEYGIDVPLDKNGNIRTLDGKPDLGAFEWQPSIGE